MKKILLAAFAALTTASGAHATVYTQVFTGVITSGSDGSGLFGGGDLSGQSFTATYVFDTAIGYHFENYNTLQNVGGSFYYDQPSPVLSASLSVLGQTIAFDPSGWAQVDDESQLWGSGAYISGVLAKSAKYSLINGVSDGTMVVGSNTLDFSGDVSQSTANNYGSFSDGAATSLNFHNNFVTTNPGNIAAVPEPASWALMLGGFGMIGGALRRRRGALSFG